MFQRLLTLRRLAPALLVAALCLPGCGKQRSPLARKKVLIIGADGMDPRLVRKLMDEGRLPNMSKLAAQGGFVPLTTSIPPQSPVAWSNFITGADAGVHGIFDFIHRDPTRQAAPYFSTNRIRTTGPEKPWKIGDYQIPRTTTDNELARRGTPFWDYLDEAGVKVAMYRLPANYPPSKSKHGNVRCLDDMGVPDALGSQGTFQHFSTRPRPATKAPEGMKLRLRRMRRSDGYEGELNGPPNELRKGEPEMKLRFQVYPDPNREVAKIVYTNEGVVSDQTVEVLLNVGQWSPWQEVIFLKTPIGPTFHTMVRFYLQSVRPYVDLYVTPLNFVPAKPEAVFSEPCDFCEKIGDEIGPYYTKGFAEDYNARKQLVFTDEEYRQQAWYVLEERMRILDYALKHYEDGLLFIYFSSSDLQAHIFWWDSDEKHPVRGPADAKKYHAVIEDVYVAIDQALGRCMEALGDDATIMVMSDHGFCNFSRGFGLNAWLKQEGYLAAKQDLLADADWSRTRAYGLGLNGLYLNLHGRERDGIISPTVRSALLDEITEKLLAVRDPKNGRKVIRRVYRSDECYHGPEAANGPDLVIGYERDYRASWGTCLGKIDAQLVMDNDSPWSADHCIAHDVVPGILICNRPIRRSEPALVDVAPTILATYGLTTPPTMTGRDFLAPTVDKLAAR